jgi:hypothetical protein
MCCRDREAGQAWARRELRQQPLWSAARLSRSARQGTSVIIAGRVITMTGFRCRPGSRGTVG